jgi:hypothetical protein
LIFFFFIFVFFGSTFSFIIIDEYFAFFLADKKILGSGSKNEYKKDKNSRGFCFGMILNNFFFNESPGH